MTHKCIHSSDEGQSPVRRFGKQPLNKILAKSDEDFLHYIRNGDDPELYRVSDLEESVHALADLVAWGGQARTQPRGLDVVSRFIADLGNEGLLEQLHAARPVLELLHAGGGAEE